MCKLSADEYLGASSSPGASRSPKAPLEKRGGARTLDAANPPDGMLCNFWDAGSLLEPLFGL